MTELSSAQAAPGFGSTEAGRPSAADPGLSIPFSRPAAVPLAQLSEPAYFADLNLDQLVSSVIAGREVYNLRPLFYVRLTSAEEARYRHGVFRDLERQDIRNTIVSFARKLRDMQDRLARARKVHHQLQRSRMFLSAAGTYCEAVESLGGDLSGAAVSSPGMRAFSEYLSERLASAAHAGLHEDVHQIESSLAQIRYTVHIRGSRITVSAYEQEADYSDDVRATFRRFQQAEPEAAAHRSKFPALGRTSPAQDS